MKPKPIRMFAVTLCLFGIAFAFGHSSKLRLTYRLILPDGYVGWVRVDFGVDSAPAMFAGSKSHEVAEIRVGEDGRSRTSDNMVILSPRTAYEFFYQKNGGLQPVPQNLVIHDLNAGGITAMAQDYNLPIKPLSWYFFIGPNSYRVQHPNSEFLKSNALPLPGRFREGGK